MKASAVRSSIVHDVDCNSANRLLWFLQRDAGQSPTDRHSLPVCSSAVDRELTVRSLRPYTARMRLVRPVFGRLSGVFVCVAACALTGCAIFTADRHLTESDGKSLLPPIQAPLEAIQLEVMFVERPVNDPLLGRALWTEMDQMAGIPADRRMELHENGFKVALAGTEPPPTLAALLDAGRIEDYEDLRGFWVNRRVSLRRGAKTDVICSHEPRSWDVKLSSEGALTENDFDKAQGVLRVNLEDVRDGWVKVHVQPEIHHGEVALQRQVKNDQWNVSARQEIHPLNSTGFTVHLNLNEMLAISADDTAAGRAGNYFFRREDDGRLMQRVVLLRIADLTRFEIATR